MKRIDPMLLLLVPLAIVMAGLFWGMAQVVIASIRPGDQFTLNIYADFFSRNDYLIMLFRTVWVAATTTAICVVIAYPVAYFIARHVKHRDLVMFLIILPWLVSLIVRTYGWIVLLGNRGIVNGMLMSIGITDEPIRLMFNTGGVIIGLVHVFCPFMILSILAAFFHLDRSLEEAAMSLRAGPFTAFRRGGPPPTMSGVMSGVVLVYLMATGAIVTPLMLGGLRDALMGTQIYREVMDMFNFPKASAIAVVLTVVAFAIIIPLQWLERRAGRHLKQGAR